MPIEVDRGHSLPDSTILRNVEFKGGSQNFVTPNKVRNTLRNNRRCVRKKNENTSLVLRERVSRVLETFLLLTIEIETM